MSTCIVYRVFWPQHCWVVHQRWQPPLPSRPCASALTVALNARTSGAELGALANNVGKCTGRRMRLVNGKKMFLQREDQKLVQRGLKWFLNLFMIFEGHSPGKQCLFVHPKYLLSVSESTTNRGPRNWSVFRAIEQNVLKYTSHYQGQYNSRYGGFLKLDSPKMDGL